MYIEIQAYTKNIWERAYEYADLFTIADSMYVLDSWSRGLKHDVLKSYYGMRLRFDPRRGNNFRSVYGIGAIVRILGSCWFVAVMPV